MLEYGFDDPYELFDAAFGYQLMLGQDTLSAFRIASAYMKQSFPLIDQISRYEDY